MVELLENHAAVVLHVSAFHVVFPDHPSLVEPFADDEQPVAIHEVLIQKSSQKDVVAQMLPDMEDELLSTTGRGVVFLPFSHPPDALELQSVPPPVGPLLQLLEE